MGEAPQVELDELYDKQHYDIVQRDDKVLFYSSTSLRGVLQQGVLGIVFIYLRMMRLHALMGISTKSANPLDIIRL